MDMNVACICLRRYAFKYVCVITCLYRFNLQVQENKEGNGRSNWLSYSIICTVTTESICTPLRLSSHLYSS